MSSRFGLSSLFGPPYLSLWPPFSLCLPVSTDREDLLLVEVITAAEFHPVHCNLFLYSTSRGGLHLADLREGALCDNNGRRYEMIACFSPSVLPSN